MPTSLQKQFPQPGLYLILNIGKNLRLSIINKQRITTTKKLAIDRLVVNFIDATGLSDKPKFAKDFCTENFFTRKTGLTSKELYLQIEDGGVEGAEIFVEFGANMGALLANLDLLFQPKIIAITGSLAKSFPAWSHSMGKMRNQHKGSKKHCPVKVI